VGAAWLAGAVAGGLVTGGEVTGGAVVGGVVVGGGVEVVGGEVARVTVTGGAEVVAVTAVVAVASEFFFLELPTAAPMMIRSTTAAVTQNHHFLYMGVGSFTTWSGSSGRGPAAAYAI
jgi:hypothetical protein